ncbi:aminotransferase class V-fold PLP-dependent enzyme [Blastopirellula sp. JC732]|uniref:Aminotransferase class V-fold PLP-dependent enzyme n=1 Tax=Blastopirellula sediminis TaxID=2894196 RepID=A0A9X1SET9_9BACT|nr:aminotransferase class V-fold PLP-dependent enzyme [Blastopirellula sediminis]MCC9608938.1 aminotransferase class V-fold PLP-dependent enzyme [Blastopirellula sediminis]MCC9628285.1 aminotransferase class V-fold PLP-dependent enzyme [Blastopirellula sediminis]
MTATVSINAISNAQHWEGKSYLNTAAEGLPLLSAVDAVQEYLFDKTHGEPGRVQFWHRYERAKELAGELFSVDADQIALISSTTEALNTIANSIDWRPGDEVVFTSSEFPSNIFPWVTLQKRGVKLRIVHPGADGVSVDELLEQINERTRLVTVSQVSYATGQRIDPAPIWRRVKDTETLLCVDATQAAARVPIDGQMADFTVASAFKWMNSIHGAAVMSVSRRVLAQDVVGPAGWLSTENCFADDRLEAFHPRGDAQRFQAGMPNFDSIYSLAAALEFHTPDAVAARAKTMAPLVSSLRASLVEMGLTPLVPESEASQAGIVPFAYNGSAEMKKQLAERGIFVQGDDRRIRAALHWYNTEEDVQRYLGALRELIDESQLPTAPLAGSRR